MLECHLSDKSSHRGKESIPLVVASLHRLRLYLWGYCLHFLLCHMWELSGIMRGRLRANIMVVAFRQRRWYLNQWNLNNWVFPQINQVVGLGSGILKIGIIMLIEPGCILAPSPEVIREANRSSDWGPSATSTPSEVIGPLLRRLRMSGGATSSSSSDSVMPNSGREAPCDGTSAQGSLHAFFRLETPVEEDGWARFAMAWWEFLIEHSSTMHLAASYAPASFSASKLRSSLLMNSLRSLIGIISGLDGFNAWGIHLITRHRIGNNKPSAKAEASICIGWSLRKTEYCPRPSSHLEVPRPCPFEKVPTEVKASIQVPYIVLIIPKLTIKSAWQIRLDRAGVISAKNEISRSNIR